MKESEIMANCDIRMASRWQHNKNLKSFGGMDRIMIYFDGQMLFLGL